jgi:hypothetical protein
MNYKKKLEVLNEKLGVSPKKSRNVDPNKTFNKPKNDDPNEEDKEKLLNEVSLPPIRFEQKTV